MRTALVVLSGGQDSTTALFWAKHNIAESVHAITFDYGQRHRIEIESAVKVAQMAGCASQEIVTIPDTILKGTSPLVDKTAKVGHYDNVASLPGGVEPTFIPMRNSLFAVIAFNRAYLLKAHAVVMGLCQIDYGGYPDCRTPFIDHLSASLHMGLYGDSGAPEHPILHPLIDLSKKQIVEMAASLPGCLDALAYSHTSYDGDYPPNPFNHASLLRAQGFHDAGIGDPLITRAIAEGKLPADYPHDGLVEGTAYSDKDKWASLMPQPAKKSKKPKEPTGETAPS